MNPIRRFACFASFGLSFACLTFVATADEGMWTFDNFPAKRVQEKFGWAPDKAWLDHVQAAAVRLTGGCSASFVSPEGLVLTNHHCVSTCIQNLSTAKQDYIENGFIAQSRDQERTCPGQQAEVVTSISDVTERVQNAIGKATGAELAKTRDAEIAAIENESCTDKEKERCQVVTLYGGGQYKLYRYRKYSDVRLVWAPEQQAAFFGGDPDNFNFPRFNLDAAFLRVYENGKPAATPQFLKWNPRAPEAGEPTFVVGNPGSTQRLFTASQLDLRRDVLFPTLVPLLSEYRGRLLASMEGDQEKTRTGNDRLHSVENSYKVFVGQWQALRDEEFRDRLAKEEAELRQRVKGKAEIGDPWSEIDKAVEEFRTYFTDYFMLEDRAGWRTDLYMYARELVRGTAEREKPLTERLPAYADSRLPLLEKQLTDEKPTYPWLEEMTLAFWLSKTRELLTADDPRVKELLGKESPEQLAKRIVAGTKLGDAKLRKELWAGGRKAVEASKDPMIQFALAVEKHARPILDRYRAEYDGPVTVAQSQLANARFAAFGDTVYPDATFSLRISYGAVEGWTERGKEVPFATTMGGTFERATGAFPYNLATKIAGAEEKIDKQTVYNFVTTNDIIGGNSGSPVIARDGSVLGAAFDGNIHSLGGSYGFDQRVNRTIVVSSAAVQEALEKIYVAPALVKELNTPVPQSLR
jgi:V8-like Glu-specific endopeptidase